MVALDYGSHVGEGDMDRRVRSMSVRVREVDVPAVPGAPHQPPSGTPTEDDYWSRLWKYIPAETLGAYLALEGVARGLWNGDALKWGLLGALVLMGLFTALYLRRVGKVANGAQLAMSLFAYVVWVFAIGGWFATFSWYKPLMGTAALVVFALGALFVPPAAVGTPNPAPAA